MPRFLHSSVSTHFKPRVVCSEGLGSDQDSRRHCCHRSCGVPVQTRQDRVFIQNFIRFHVSIIKRSRADMHR